MKLDRIIAVRNNKTVYRDGDLCLKVFDNTYSKAQVLNEALNHALVEETGLNVPKLREVTVIDGKWTIITDYVGGVEIPVAKFIVFRHTVKTGMKFVTGSRVEIGA